MTGNKLLVTKFDGTSVTLELNGNNLEIDRGSGPLIINNSNVQIACDPAGCFTHKLASGDGINPESLEAKLTVNSKTSEGLPYSQYFSTIKYLRK
jgi:hypothetical protein